MFSSLTDLRPLGIAGDLQRRSDLRTSRNTSPTTYTIIDCPTQEFTIPETHYIRVNISPKAYLEKHADNSHSVILQPNQNHTERSIYACTKRLADLLAALS